MTRNFNNSLLGILGPTNSAPPPTAAWDELERGLGVQLPDDYKEIVVGYGPVQLNGHLYLSHPSTDRWNLGRWMEETVEAFSRSDLSEAECPGFPYGPVFGGPAGLIPLLSTDRGEYVFGVFDTASKEWRLLACDGDELDFYEYRMSFSEWLYWYLSGDDMFGPDSAVFYPGPIVFESLPMTESERSTKWYGPGRGPAEMVTVE
ncbi:SMI1/KNR4 family protein [Streptomyces sp. NPDC001315]|uniref:SMI1/KNR4 family protein n=1 Tax=Streptomyces sp. NPDC001315 TaxID=3364562 RepID=UPI00369DE8FF